MKQQQFNLDEGLARRNKAWADFEVTHGWWLETARQEAAAECRRSPTGTVTIDYVYKIMGGPPEGAHPSIIGAVFAKGFIRVGFTKSTRVSNRGRTIAVWKIKPGGPYDK